MGVVGAAHSPAATACSAGTAAGADPFDLEARFVEKHRRYFKQAFEEIMRGHKASCWSWYIFPTAPMVVNGRERGSPHNREFALRDVPPAGLRGDSAARAYLRFAEIDGVSLRRNYIAIMSEVAKQLETGVTPYRLVGGDVPRLKASLELFERVAGEDDFDIEVHELSSRALLAMEKTTADAAAARRY